MRKRGWPGRSAHAHGAGLDLFRRAAQGVGATHIYTQRAKTQQHHAGKEACTCTRHATAAAHGLVHSVHARMRRAHSRGNVPCMDRAPTSRKKHQQHKHTRGMARSRLAGHSEARTCWTRGPKARPQWAAVQPRAAAVLPTTSHSARPCRRHLPSRCEAPGRCTLSKAHPPEGTCNGYVTAHDELNLG